MVTVVVSAGVGRTAATSLVLLEVLVVFVAAVTADGKPPGDVLDDETALPNDIESGAFALRRLEGPDLAAGKSSCETAMAISERNRAKKKRLSIQGTGSNPPDRNG